MCSSRIQGASKAKRRRILEAAEAEAQEVAELQALREKANETRVSADDLKGGHGPAAERFHHYSTPDRLLAMRLVC